MTDHDISKTTEVLDAIETVLLAAGPTFSGGQDQARYTAAEWQRYGFTAEQVRRWCEAEVWQPSVAARLQHEGYAPRHMAVQARHVAEQYGIDDPIYSICNGDLPVGAFCNCGR